MSFTFPICILHKTNLNDKLSSSRDITECLFQFENNSVQITDITFDSVGIMSTNLTVKPEISLLQKFTGAFIKTEIWSKFVRYLNRHVKYCFNMYHYFKFFLVES